ncbi:hypothetical protein BCR43DRAFT_560420 [Syncephalastrum racemosum]|uniref:Uncharacterized protein n=1 Tax=Syncephalastrum racemosum TaxID=13706 RepID=A0A1X2HW83_SYNRA|nr:hypothetical protein BCR43DRAFT_560420 [Syncephalastrum racemosum]
MGRWLREEKRRFNYQDHLIGIDKSGKRVLKKKLVVGRVSNVHLEVPVGTYATADAEWHEGHGDCLYLPRLGIQHSLPPILVEVQNVVNTAFMTRSVRYCQQIHTLHGRLPILVIFCVDKLTPAAILSKFKLVESSTSTYTLQHHDFWAKSVYLIKKPSISLDGDGQLHPLEAVGSFLSQKCPTLHGHPYTDNPVIRTLYEVVKQEY